MKPLEFLTLDFFFLSCRESYSLKTFFLHLCFPCFQVFLDNFEEYEAQLEAQMKAMNLAQTDLGGSDLAGNGSVSIPRECADNRLSRDSAEIPNASMQHSNNQPTAVDNAVYSGTFQSEDRKLFVEFTNGETTTKLTPGQAASSPIPNRCDKQDSGQSAGSKQKQGSHRKGHKTPSKAQQTKTPGSKGRYTSVKDLLSANGCSPVAKKLFSEKKNEGEKAHAESEMSQFVQKTGTVSKTFLSHIHLNF